MLTSKALFETISQAAQDAIIMIDNQGQIAYWNPAAERMFGYMPEEVYGKDVHLLLAPSRFWDKYKEGFKLFQQTGSGIAVGKTLEFSALKKDQTEFYIELSVSSIQFDDKWQAIAIIRDITERKKTQEELLEANLKFQAISDSAYDGIIMFTTYGKINYWNKAAERIYGYSKEDIIGKNINMLIPSEVPDSGNCFFSKILNQIENISQSENFFESNCLTQSGALITTEISVSKIQHNNEKNIVAVVRDITERKRKDEKLLEYQNHLQAIYDSIIDGVVILDIESFAFVETNQSFNNMFGYSGDELKGLSVKDIHPDYALERVIKECKEKIEGKRSFSIDIPCKRKDGTIFYVDIAARKIKYNIKPCLIGFFRDITERKTSEKIKENFIATLSHDLRVPLLAENHALKYLIKGSYGELSETQMNAAKNMLNSNEDLLSLVKTLLDVYRFEAEGLKILKEEINLFDLINLTISKLNPFIENSNKQINLDFQDELVILFADKKSITRVLINLIHNAIAYTHDNSEIEISISKDDEFVTVSIKDDGYGIPESDLEKIFELYYTSSKKFRKVGTGLGLYLSKQIISAHGGKIWVESELEKGSNFCFKLPLS
ncbi:MAG: PAS domain-containing sensor histidine kinase [Cyanobacteriota bacterium]